MVGHRPLKSADVGSTPAFPTILVTGGLLVSQSRFEREPRRSDSYSVIHCKEGPAVIVWMRSFVVSCPRLGIGRSVAQGAEEYPLYRVCLEQIFLF